MSRRRADVALAVKRLQHRHHRALSRALAQLGLSLVQWDTLRHLDRKPEASLHDLALLTFQTDQSFGSLASRMVDRGFIERVPGPGRAVKHRLTAEGERLRVAGQELVDEVFEQSFGGLTDHQLDQLGDLLDAALGADSPWRDVRARRHTGPVVRYQDREQEGPKTAPRRESSRSSARLQRPSTRD